MTQEGDRKEETGYRCPVEGRELIFAKGPKGKMIPLEKLRASSVYLVQETTTEGLICVPLITDGDLYLTHYVSCHDPARFSKSKPRSS